MKRYKALPTWLLASVASPWLPEEHPLKETPALQQWHDSRTTLCKLLDFALTATAVAALLGFCLAII